MCTKIGTIVKLHNGVLTFMRVRCKSWTCPECSIERRNRLIAEAKAGQPNRFITLTVNPAWFDSPDQRAAELAAAWRKIRAKYHRLWPQRECQFLAVFEATERGEPHLHICWRGGWIDQKWLSSEMKRLMGAPIVDVRTVKTAKKVAEYVTKYISKRSIHFGTCKRYWRSARYMLVNKRKQRKEENKGAYWWRLDCHWKQYVRECLRRGLTLAARPGGAWECEYPSAKGWPPWCTVERPVVSS